MSKAFGVGCFNFGYKKPVPFEFRSSSYVQEVKRDLGLLTSISEIRISYDEGFDSVLSVTEEPSTLRDGECFPQIPFFELDFIVFIPARVQKEMFPGENLEKRIGVEKFRVSIRHGYHGPFSFVECLSPHDHCDPSSAVRLIREYISREFSKLSTPVTFEYIGPSPFHVDFFVSAEEGGIDGIQMREVERRGYNEIVFIHDKSISSDEALEFVYSELGHELDLYYAIQRSKVQMIHMGHELLDEWRNLQEAATTLPSVFNARKRFRLHRDARNLVLNALSLQAEFDVRRRDVSEDVANTYRKDVPRYIEHHVRDKSEKLPAYPIESILQWARHIEEDSFKLAQIVAVVVSALGGGIIGSLATILSSGVK
ncbi:hypothetical protein [Burkholderia cepacia]|uniref:hypothetical protein n=1 Tax=Burkholderia cepacia TaxID=292 RepID=UPI000A8EEABD|nr:hypothetical protein [Burkholderia cepacia]